MSRPDGPRIKLTGPKRPAMLPTLELTLGDLLTMVEPERYPPDVAGRLRQLWPLPIGELAARDLHFLVGQGIGASLVLPLALELLEREPLLVAVEEPGDLLSAVFTTGLEQVRSREQLRGRARFVLGVAEKELRGRPAASAEDVTLLDLVRAAAVALREQVGADAGGDSAPPHPRS